MLKIFLSMLIIIFSFLMYFLSHPLSMGLMILIQTLLTCLLSGMLINTYWFSYILFLTFMGGLLVLFIYISSIASNELFLFSNTLFLFSWIFILMMMFSMTFYLNLKWMNFTSNNEMTNFFNKFMFFNNEEKMDLSKLYNTQTFMLMTMMMIYLFITLLAVVKITNIFYGPIRSNMY